jgi:hypothetical protein
MAMAVCAAMAFTLASATGAERKVENEILVGGGISFKFTTHSAECWTRQGKLVGFQTPDTHRAPEDPSHPEVTGMLQGGAWYFDLHSPDDRYFHNDNATGVVPKQEPHGWTITLDRAALSEWYTARVVPAEVSGTITCTYTHEMPGK